MPDEPPVLIVDLDGTLLSVSSFRCWARFLVHAPFPHRSRAARMRISLEVAAVLVARRVRLIDHAELRSRLQRTWRAAVAGDDGAAEQAFLDDMERFIRPELRPMLHAIAAGQMDAILATAAVPDYAHALGARLGFPLVVAAPVPRGAEPGVPKRDAVRRLLRATGWQDRRLVLLTDHHDDLPLARDCGEVVWFGDRAGEAALRAGAPAVLVSPRAAAWPR